MAALVNANGVKLGTFDGGATRAKVSAVASHTRQDFYEVELTADPDNTGLVYGGPVTVTTGAVDAVFALKAGMSWRLFMGGTPFRFNPEALYVVGSAASQKLYVRLVTAEGRRQPRQGA